MAALILASFALALDDPLSAQQVHRNGFETSQTTWLRGQSDAGFKEVHHDITDLTAHTGQSSEHFVLVAEPGTFIYYFYPTGNASLNEETSASVWAKCNRPGVQLLARLVLPHESDPANLEQRLTTTLRGDTYQTVGRWQRLELRRPLQFGKEQQQLMRAQLKRDIDFTDAYVDRLTLNLYCGPGRTEVWVDDLEIGPVEAGAPFQTTSRPSNPGERATLPPRSASRTSPVELKQDRLTVGGKPIFIRGIRHSNTPLAALRDAGFNTLWLDSHTSPALLEEAVNLGFWVVPTLPAAGPGAESPLTAVQMASRFSAGDAALFYDLGGGLVEEQREAVMATAEQLHAADPQCPLGGDIWDGFRPYSRSLDLIGVHRWPLLTGLELSQYREWLEQRHNLMRPGSFFWTWIQTQLPDWYTKLVYGRTSEAGFDEPVGPQPEQIRLLTYTALAAGCRGLGFWSDRFLADSHQGRDRLLALALINLELQMLEPLLVTADPPRWVKTSIGEVGAAVMHTEHGMLVLPIWLGRGSQFVPGQLATPKLTIVVPEVPIGTQAWEVSPALVRSLPTQRVIGGTQVTIPEFGLTSLIIFTADNNPTGLVVRLQDQHRRMAKLAAQWSHDLAEVELNKVSKIESQLAAAGHPLVDGQQLLTDARNRLRDSVEHFNSGDYTDAYLESERALRPLRILMRGQWDDTVKKLDAPVSSPYAVSFFTLPRHWQFMEQFPAGATGPNLLPGGGFETAEKSLPPGWNLQETKLDLVNFYAGVVTDQPGEGQRCLLLEIKAPPPPAVPPKALERTYLAVRSPAVRVQPGTPVRISGWLRVPQAVSASVDGAMFYDSAGGEPLAIRQVAPQPAWKKFTLFRTAPESGLMTVTLALTGLGKAYFDDIRIEPITPGAQVPVTSPASTNVPAGSKGF
jgi:hypothetical protein